MEYSPKKVNEMLDNHQFTFKKKFGQNFIVDENIIKSIISKSNIDENTLVIEIGPGSGSLTYRLAEKANRVICYEIDTTLKAILDENLNEYKNIEIIFEDFLTADVSKTIKKYDNKEVCIIANLPYYITTPILMKIIGEKIDVSKIIIMVQKEVGDRFKASPNSKDYGSLSIFLQYYFDIKKIMDVSRNVFLPKPNVDSIVVEFVKKSQAPVNKIFFNLVRDSFTQKRKTLRNNLKGYDLNKIEEILIKHGFDLSVRAEALSIEIFIEIANVL